MAALPISEAFSFSRAISHGFEALKRNPVAWIVAGFLLSLSGGGGGGGNNFSGLNRSGTGDPDLDALMQGMEAGLAVTTVGIACCCGFVGMILRAWIVPGFVRMSRDMVVNGSAELGTLFSATDVFMTQFLWELLKGLIGFGTFVVAAIPGGAVLGAAFLMADGGEPNVALLIAGGALMVLIAVPILIYVQLGLLFGEYHIALDGSGVMEALERSWSLASGNRLHLFLFNIVTGLVAVLGILLCCVGIWATAPAVRTGAVEAFLLATRDDWEGFAFPRELGL